MRKKIILFTSSYPYGLTETFLHNEVLSLAKHFEVEIYPTMKQHQREVPRKLPPNISFHAPFLSRSYAKRFFFGVFNFAPLFPFLKDFFKVLKESKNKKASLKQWGLFLTTNRMKLSNPLFKSAIKDINQNDIIYFYWGNFPVHLIRGLPEKNVFVRVHGGEVNFERNHQYIPLIQDKIRSNKTTYLPISEDARHRIKQINPSANCVISRLGVEYKGRNPENENRALIRIVSCSNVLKIKRVHLILEALSNIGNKKVEWVHFGDGVLLDTIKEKAQFLPDNINTHFKGRIPNAEVIEFYKNTSIDLFINVSETEGVPVSIMEALSFGIPCFATDAGGTSEILDDTGGKLVPINFEQQELSSFICNIKDESNKEVRQGAFELWKSKCNAQDTFRRLLQALNK